VLEVRLRGLTVLQTLAGLRPWCAIDVGAHHPEEVAWRHQLSEQTTEEADEIVHRGGGAWCGTRSRSHR
jgi:hypothetical protein